jgi:diguanylate cyclase (GGDEF)-like protein
MADLRATIRDAIARGIPLVLDRDRFLRKIVDVIAESAGYPSVAVYVTSADGLQLILGAATDGVPQWLPTRLPADIAPTSGPALVQATDVLDALQPGDERRMLLAPLLAGSELVGLLLLLDIQQGAILDEDLSVYAAMAEEIAPAIGVSARHHDVEQTSVVDLPTGAYTYDFFLQRLEEEVARAQRTSHAVTIVLVEAWHFEEFERAAGYEMADQMLRDLASSFTAVMRTSDVVARRRRSGFALLLPESDIEGANVTITRVHDRLQRVEQGLRDSGYEGPLPGIIVGWATFPDDGSSGPALVLAADQRMLAQADDPDAAVP